MSVTNSAKINGPIVIDTTIPGPTGYNSSCINVIGNGNWQTDGLSITNTSATGSTGGAASYQFLVGGSSSNSGAAGIGGFGIYSNYLGASNINSGFAFNINSNGNIGIGTTNPQYKLDVNGNANITVPTASNTNPNLTLSGGVSGVGGAYLQLLGSGSAGENVGINFDCIGRPTPATSIRSLDNGNYSGALQFLTANPGSNPYPLQQVSMTINPQATGNAFVGIGTTNPSYPLDISGNSGTLLRLQNNTQVYNNSSANIEFWTTATGNCPLGSISMKDLSYMPPSGQGGPYNSQMSFNVNFNSTSIGTLINGMTLTGTSYASNSGANLTINWFVLYIRRRSGVCYTINRLLFLYRSHTTIIVKPTRWECTY